MLPLQLFRSRAFSVANLASFVAYGALAGAFFLLPIQLQVTSGYAAWTAGVALLPLPILTLVLSPFGGELTARYGARIPLVCGSLSCTVALLLAMRIGPDASYATEVLPVMVLTGVGVPLITPPITATVLNAVPDGRVAIASAVNNGIARTAGLVAVAALPLLAGLPQDAAQDAAALDRGYGTGMLICSALFLSSGIVAWLGLPRPAAAPAQPLGRRHGSVTCPQLEPSRD
jgi:MFS family permease